MFSVNKGGMASLIVSVMLAALSFGCIQTTREHLFSGRAVTHIASAITPENASGSRQSSEEVSVQGWLVHDTTGRFLTLTFSNQSQAAIPMSALVDEYSAKTDDGRIFILKEVDFLNYPEKLIPGDERTVTIALPRNLSAAMITQVVAKLNQGKVVVVLQSIGPREPPAWRVGRSEGIVIAGQASAMRMDLQQADPARPPPVIEKPVGPVAPRSEAPVGTVPVMVEFQQALGSTLRAEVFWNDSNERITLRTGEEQLFYLIPGQHEFHAISRLPFMFETHARAPLVVTATAPIRVQLGAEARLSGVELRMRVYSADKKVLDERFSPLSSGRH